VSERPIVLDASALLALLLGEPGAEQVATSIPQAVMSAVNLSEVVAKLVEWGAPADGARENLGAMDMEIHAFDEDLAHMAGELRRSTRDRGLSLGDRACLALATQLGAVALTADRSWTGWTQGGASVALIR